MNGIVTKYNNLVKQYVWYYREANDAKVVSQILKVEELQKDLLTQDSLQGGQNGSSNNQFIKDKGLNIPEWMKAYKGKVMPPFKFKMMREYHPRWRRRMHCTSQIFM